MSDSPYTPILGCPPPFAADRVPRLSFISVALKLLIDGHREVVNHPRLWVGEPGEGATTILHLASDYARSLGFAVGKTTLIPEVDNAERVVSRLAKVRLALETPRAGVRRRRRAYFKGNNDTWSILSSAGTQVGYILRDTARAALAAGYKGFLFLVDDLDQGSAEEIQMLLDAARVAHSASPLDAPVIVELAADQSKFDTIRSLDIDLGDFSRRRIYNLSRSDVGDALEAPLQGSPMSWNQIALDQAALFSGGIPFLVQAIGDSAWKLADCEGAREIDPHHVERAFPHVQSGGYRRDPVGHLYDDRHSL